MADELDTVPLNKSLAGWIPFRAGWTGGTLAVDWCHLGQRRLVEPFFHQTIAQAMSEPFNLAFQQRTPMEELLRLAEGVPIAGFIFHMSRCGSTLCAQALAAFEENIVVSEAAPIHTLLRAPEFGPLGETELAEWLRGLINAYAQPRFPGEQRLLVKFAASDAIHVPLISRIFPNVPWVFLYRDPLEILASHLSLAGAEFVPGGIAPHHLGLGVDLSLVDADTYRAHCLAALGRAALAADRQDGRGLFVNYRRMPGALLDEILPHFGLTLSETDRAVVLQRARRHSKAPTLSYADDFAEKQAAAAHLHRIVEAIVGPVVSALEARQR